MSAIARRPDGTLVVTVRLTLRPGRDDTLIAAILAAPDRGLAAVVREAMREGTQPANDVANDERPIDLMGLGIDL